MTKTYSLCLFLMAIISCAADGQTSNKYILKAAKKDTRHFRLDNAVWKQYGKNKLPYRSDYFKPNAATTSDTTLLRDSAYVAAFREHAFYKNAHRRTTGHYVWIWGSVLAGVILIFYVIIVLTFTGPFD